jgi:hypothetical protein
MVFRDSKFYVFYNVLLDIELRMKEYLEMNAPPSDFKELKVQ